MRKYLLVNNQPWLIQTILDNESQCYLPLQGLSPPRETRRWSERQRTHLNLLADVHIDSPNECKVVTMEPVDALPSRVSWASI